MDDDWPTPPSDYAPGEEHAQGDAVLAGCAFLLGFGIVAWIVLGRPLWTAATTHPGYGMRVAR